MVLFQKKFIMANNKLKKQSKNQVNNIMTGEIPALIANVIQKVSTQFNEGQKQLANLSKANKTLKELLETCKKKITVLEKIMKELDKKNIQGNQQKYDNKNSNADKRNTKPPVMYYPLCRRTNDSINVRINYPNPKPGHRWYVTFRTS